MNPIFTRTSIRQFTEQPVEAKKITALLKAAMAAPSAMNQQPWEFYVVTNSEKLQELRAGSPYTAPLASAPAAIVICYRDDLKMPEYAQIDCAIATENIWLEMENQGLGGVMIGIAPFTEQMAAVEKVLDLPANLHAFTIIPFGYPAQKKPQQDRYDETRIHFVK
ncbi:nitroreductase family protein [Selenomonas ruminantium]|uniref:Nitroreductase n=1 Tax=Selenomonas ruminantium TaxID=971 RepID=A0A1H0NHI6_SELRU|nr:nitroreductase family protein [Selenomonas ruminantium]SDO92038.1 Nitroreductase [Selenomonas ruminantium]